NNLTQTEGLLDLLNHEEMAKTYPFFGIKKREGICTKLCHHYSTQKRLASVGTSYCFRDNLTQTY
ncbi:hypothetical protein AB9K17_23665, partial [Salmonella enterica subsp. enterica serovar Kentucky]|uniref:hypothetical protein n=1 Tax=Salmonella enterica TaxID=28901 RepID=UPI003F4C7A73